MIYFVESTPGGGKSYYSQKIYRHAEKETVYYKEEYRNPLDLLRQAVLHKEEFDGFLDNIRNLCTDKLMASRMEERIAESVTVLDDLYFVPFTQIKPENEAIRSELSKLYYKEYNDGLVSCSAYCDLLYRRMDAFLSAGQPDIDYIFEGALFHNPLLNFLGFYDLQKKDLIDYYRKLYSLLNKTEYEIVLICAEDPESIIRTTIRNREQSGDHMWRQGFEKWFLHSKHYSDARDIEGIIAVSKDIAAYEQLLLKEIPFNRRIVERRVDHAECNADLRM